MLPKSQTSDNQKLFGTVKGLTKNNNICKYIKPPVHNWLGTVKALATQILPPMTTQIQSTGSTLSKA